MKTHIIALGAIVALALTGCQNVDGKKLAMGAAAIGAVGAVGYYAGKHHQKDQNGDKSDSDRDREDGDHYARGHHHQRVEKDDMTKYCAGEAAGQYHVNPRYITTLPLEHDGDHYSVYGQFDGRDGGVSTFTCTFSDNGKFRSLQATS